MCGRFTLALSPEDVAALLNLNSALDEELGLAPRWNVAPGQTVLAAARPEPDAPPAAALFRWGLVPSWADDPSVSARLINARSETAASKPSFRDAYRRRRCLVPADGFYEWQRAGTKKQPWIFRVKDEPGFCFAGLWEMWNPPQDDSPLHTCTILTTTANELMAPVHDRMPVILLGDDRRAWLDPETDERHLRSLTAPLSADLMIAHPVSDLVNSPRNDTAECAAPCEPPAPEPENQGRLF